MLSELDCDFYTSFYDDLSNIPKTPIAINEHYLTVGKKQGRVANKKELNALLAQLLNFDINVYSTANLCWNFKSNLKVHCKNADFVDHYYSPEGNLRKNDLFRIINQNELQTFINKWDSIYDTIIESVNFNLLFYKTFYKIPNEIHNLRDLQINWLKRGVFMGEKPNLKSLDENTNILGEIVTLLVKNFNIDTSFISKYRNHMKEYASINSIMIPSGLDDTNTLLFLFLNTGHALRMFFNNNELETYRNNRLKQYESALNSIKNSTYKPILNESLKHYEKQSMTLRKKEDEIPIPIVKTPFHEITSVLNIIKLSNSVSLNCFKKIYNSDDMTVVIPLMVQHELANCIEPVLNSMEIKILVASLVYNAFVLNKTDKQQYNDFVKSKSIEILSKLFVEAGMTDFENVLEQDINFIIENKKIVKLCYLKNLVISVFVQILILKL